MKQLLAALSMLLYICPAIYSQDGNKQDWLKRHNFSVQDFMNPSPYFAPYTRWWWPGNDVTQEELKREMKMFSENNFGGVEIQPMALVFPTKGKGRADRIMSYDTPEYYNNLFAMFDEAKKFGLTVDMTSGSGWPSGGPHLTEEDNNLTLSYGIIDVPQGNTSLMKIPRTTRADRPKAKLLTLLAAKVIPSIKGEEQTLHLDPNSITDISSNIKDSLFTFTPKESGWKVIAFWSMADMERPMLMAKRQEGFAVNHFDSAKVVKNYEHYFGKRTHMERYYGNPLRAIFNDSYEFKADRHYADNFREVFKQNRGYDVTPFLPASIWIGYNNMYERMANPHQKPSFKLTDEDWRIRYDYDLTLSDLLYTQFLGTSKKWSESRGLLHRTQTYGMNMDIMSMAGYASIPEVETMQFSKGSEGGYKLITSGAHLYNRPIVSSETGVYIKRAFMTTPQKRKLTIDKLLSSGVNHIIWHGTPYKYYPEGYPKEGWYPFYNAALGINFSSRLNEENPYWKYIGQINKYAQRAQYILRSGKPQADVLIYFPFLNYSEETANPNEILLNGYMKDVEPYLDTENVTASFSREIDTEWLNKIWPLINDLNAKGITWDWVNDKSIQEMSVSSDKQLEIRGNNYKGILLFDLPYIQLKSAQQLVQLAKSGANILAVGDLPKIQPSYCNYQENDKLTAQAMSEVVKQSSTSHINGVGEMDSWSNKLNLPLKSKEKYDFIKQTRRVMDDGSIAQFYWNISDQYKKTAITLDRKFKYAYWIDAEKATVVKANILKDRTVEYQLPPYGTIFLYASSTILRDTELSRAALYDPSLARPIKALDKWTIQTDSVSVDNADLFDWRTNELYKSSSQEGIYTTTFDVANIKKGKKYYLDLGKVYYSADVMINETPVGSVLYAPFVLDVTAALKKGNNQITITVTPTQYNDFVNRANNSDKLYKTFKDSELMPQGLVGPVNIYEQ